MTRSSAEATAKSLACPICLDTLTAPVVTACGHRFCEACIRAALCHKKECPTCRSKVSCHRELRADGPLADLLGTAPKALAVDDGGDSAPDTWPCSTCTMANPLGAGRCVACGARRPAKAVPLPGRSCDAAEAAAGPHRRGGTSGRRPRIQHQSRPGELPVTATHTGGDERNEDGECEDSGEPEEQSAAVSSPCKNASLPVELHSLGQQLGSYATPEDAAVAYRQELEAAGGHRELSMTWNGLKLHPSTANETCFRGVAKSGKCKTSFTAFHAKRYLGSYATVGQAAKAYAQHAASVNPQPDRELALLPGMVLHRTSRGGTGFKGVFKTGAGRFRAMYSSDCLGTFATAEAAAIAYAHRHPPLEVEEDEPEVEGLELVRSTTSATGFKGVTKLDSKYVAKYDRTVLGRFRTAEAAAVAYARHVQHPSYRKRNRWDGHHKRQEP